MERRADEWIAPIAETADRFGDLASALSLPFVLAGGLAFCVAAGAVVYLACLDGRSTVFPGAPSRRPRPVLAACVGVATIAALWQGSVLTASAYAADPRAASLRAEMRVRCTALAEAVSRGRVNWMTEKQVRQADGSCGEGVLAAASRAASSRLQLVVLERRVGKGGTERYPAGVPREPDGGP